MAAEKEYSDSNIVKALLENGADINAKNNDGRTALMQVANNLFGDKYSDKYSRLLEFFINSGADTTVQDKDGKTALMYLSQNITNFVDKHSMKIIKNGMFIYYGPISRFNSVSEEDFINNLKLIINSSEVNIQDNDGKTALMYAPFAIPDVAKIFIENGANVNIRDNNRQTALMVAVKSESHSYDDFKNISENIDFLIKSGTDIDAQDNDRQYGFNVSRSKTYGWRSLCDDFHSSEFSRKYSFKK